MMHARYADGLSNRSRLVRSLSSAYPNITPAQALSCLQYGKPLASGSNQIDGNGYVNARAAVQCALDLAGGGDLLQ